MYNNSSLYMRTAQMSHFETSTLAYLKASFENENRLWLFLKMSLLQHFLKFWKMNKNVRMSCRSFQTHISVLVLLTKGRTTFHFMTSFSSGGPKIIYNKTKFAPIKLFYTIYQCANWIKTLTGKISAVKTLSPSLQMIVLWCLWSSINLASFWSVIERVVALFNKLSSKYHIGDRERNYHMEILWKVEAKLNCFQWSQTCDRCNLSTKWLFFRTCLQKQEII